MTDLLPNLIGIVAVLLVIVAVFETLRRGIVPERFAAVWIILSVLLLLLAIFPQLASWAAEAVGVELPSNLLFFVAAFFLLLISVDFSYEIGKLDARTRRLAEEVALLQNDIVEMRSAAKSPDPQE